MKMNYFHTMLHCPIEAMLSLPLCAAKVYVMVVFNATFKGNVYLIAAFPY